MASINAPIGIYPVAEIVRESNIDLGYACLNSNINKWSKIKPIRGGTQKPVDLAFRKLNNYGNTFYIGNINTIMGEVETDTWGTYAALREGTDWFRATDWEGYNSEALPWYTFDYPSEIGTNATIYLEFLRDTILDFFELGILAGYNPSEYNINFGLIGGNNPYDVDYYIPLTDLGMSITELLDAQGITFNSNVLGEGIHYLYPVLTTNSGSSYPRDTKLYSFNETSGWIAFPFVEPIKITVDSALEPDPVDDIFMHDLFGINDPVASVSWDGVDYRLTASAAYVSIENQSSLPHTLIVKNIINKGSTSSRFPEVSKERTIQLAANQTLNPYDIIDQSFTNVAVVNEYGITMEVEFYVQQSGISAVRKKTISVLLTDK